MPTGGEIKQVSLGDSYSSAIISDGTNNYLYTWGYNYYGQLGDGNKPNDSLVPIKASLLSSSYINSIIKTIDTIDESVNINFTITDGKYAGKLMPELSKVSIKSGEKGYVSELNGKNPTVAKLQVGENNLKVKGLNLGEITTLDLHLYSKAFPNTNLEINDILYGIEKNDPNYIDGANITNITSNSAILDLDINTGEEYNKVETIDIYDSNDNQLTTNFGFKENETYEALITGLESTTNYGQLKVSVNGQDKVNLGVSLETISEKNNPKVIPTSARQTEAYDTKVVFEINIITGEKYLSVDNIYVKSDENDLNVSSKQKIDNSTYEITLNELDAGTNYSNLKLKINDEENYIDLINFEIQTIAQAPVVDSTSSNLLEYDDTSFKFEINIEGGAGYQELNEISVFNEDEHLSSSFVKETNTSNETNTYLITVNNLKRGHDYNDISLSINGSDILVKLNGLSVKTTNKLFDIVMIVSLAIMGIFTIILLVFIIRLIITSKSKIAKKQQGKAFGKIFDESLPEDEPKKDKNVDNSSSTDDENEWW